MKILTKGDNNMGDDREGMIYAPGQNWVTRDEVIGSARGLVTLGLFYPVLIECLSVSTALSHLLVW